MLKLVTSALSGEDDHGSSALSLLNHQMSLPGFFNFYQRLLFSVYLPISALVLYSIYLPISATVLYSICLHITAVQYLSFADAVLYVPISAADLAVSTYCTNLCCCTLHITCLSVLLYCIVSACYLCCCTVQHLPAYLCCCTTVSACYLCCCTVQHLPAYLCFCTTVSTSLSLLLYSTLSTCLSLLLYCIESAC